MTSEVKAASEVVIDLKIDSVTSITYVSMPLWSLNCRIEKIYFHLRLEMSCTSTFSHQNFGPRKYPITFPYFLASV